MINKIKINKKDNRLLFDSINNIKRLNILFGGNGVGKSTLLNYISNNYIDVDDNNYIVKSYINSRDNSNINRNKELATATDFIKAINCNSYSEGQAILHNLLSFLQDIKELKTDKTIIICMDEIDSGMSAENINMILWQIKELLETKNNIQFFISCNNYHFVYCFKEVLNMYDGKYIKINSYEQYFELLNKGIKLMNESGKRQFDFLDIY